MHPCAARFPPRDCTGLTQCHVRRASTCRLSLFFTSASLAYTKFLFFFTSFYFALLFLPVVFSLVKSCERDRRCLVDASPLLARSAPERRAGRAADQSKNATQEWENFLSSRVPRKRAKARSLRFHFLNE